MGTNPPMTPNKGQSSGHRIPQVTKIKPALRPQATKPLKKLKRNVCILHSSIHQLYVTFY